MPFRRSSLTLALLAFLLATPAVRALCDAACASGTASHHAAAPSALPAVHHEHHEHVAAAATIPDAALSAADPARCDVPALDAVAAAKSADVRPMAAPTAEIPAAPQAISLLLRATISASPPGASPPALSVLRI